MEYQQKKFPFLLILGVVLIVGVGLAYGYYQSQSNFVKGQLVNMDKEIAQIETTIAEIGSSDTVSAQRAVKALEIIKKEEVLWSDVLSILNRVVPNDPTAKQKYVTFTSYSGSEGGLLSFNGYSIASNNMKKQLNDIADTITAFNEISEFENAFVPSISKSVNESEEIVLSIIFNTTYIPSAANQSSEEVPDDDSEGVSRR